MGSEEEMRVLEKHPHGVGNLGAWGDNLRVGHEKRRWRAQARGRTTIRDHEVMITDGRNEKKRTCTNSDGEEWWNEESLARDTKDMHSTCTYEATNVVP